MTSLKQRIYRVGAAIAVLAVAAVPLTMPASAITENTVINATIGSTISISNSTDPVSINLTPGGSAVVSSASDVVTVNTNNTTGYTLTLANADATRTLVSGGNSIAAHSGTLGTPSVLADNTWGYAIAGSPFSGSYSAENNNTSSSSLWAGVPASGSPDELKETNATATNDQTTVWYGVRVNSSQPNGVYSDTVTYSATTNP